MFLSLKAPAATYPSAGGQGEKPKMRLLMKKMHGFTTNAYSRKMLEKPKRRRSADFENGGLGVVYA